MANIKPSLLFIAKTDLQLFGKWLQKRRLKSGAKTIITYLCATAFAAVLIHKTKITKAETLRVWGRTLSSFNAHHRAELNRIFANGIADTSNVFTPTKAVKKRGNYTRIDTEQTGFIRLDTTITGRVKWTPIDLNCFFWLILQKHGARRSITAAADTIVKHIITDNTESHRNNGQLRRNIVESLRRLNDGEAFVQFVDTLRAAHKPASNS